MNPYWGAANTPYERFLTPKYQDGTDSSRSSSFVNGNQLPNPRNLSNFLLNNDLFLEFGWQYSGAAFGQLIAHDVTRAASSTGKENNI